MQTLQAMMKARGLRQTELATLLGVSEPTMSRWARREADIPLRHAERIASFLGVPVAEVVAVGVATGATEAA